MPEGHSIHRLARRHERLLLGRPVRASSPQGRFAEGAALIDGQVLDEVDAWGKHLFHRYDDLWLHIHLGLFGRFRDGKLDADSGGDGAPEPRGALRLRLLTTDHWTDLRGPTACELLTEVEREVLLARLGPDPLRPDAGSDSIRESLRERLARSRSPIGTLLLDQSAIAGIGNVYRAEILFRHGIDPLLPARDVDPTTWDAAWADLAVLMTEGVRTGRIVTTRPEDRERPAGRPRKTDATYVYGRSGRACRVCGTTVERDELGARTLYWCPVCQAR